MKQKQRVKDQKPTAKSKKGSLTEDTMSYYKRAYQNFKQETCQDPENKSIFLLNVLRQLKTELLPVCQNQTVSHFVETFLKNAGPKHLFYMWKMMCPSWTEFCTDRCTSHIMHKTLLLLPATFDVDPAELHVDDEDKEEMKIEAEDDSNNDSGGGKKCQKKTGSKKEPVSARESFLQFCDFLDDNIEAFITDVYASHIVRVSLHVLANRPVRDTTTTKGQKFQKDAKDFQLKIANDDENFIKCFFKISKHICALENIYSYFTHKLANPVIQVLVQLMMDLDQDTGRKLCSKIIKQCGFLDIPPVDPDTTLIDSSRLPDLMMNPVASYLAEELLRSCSNNLYLTWYECSFKDRLIAYAVNGVSSYVLHLVIDRCLNKGMLKVIYAELEPYIEDILALNHMGIIKSLANICQKFGCKQKKFVNSLMNAFHCSEEEKRKDFVLLLLVMKTYDIYFNSGNTGANTTSETPAKDSTSEGQQYSTLSYPIENHGSMLVQTLLRFSNPQIVVSSFLQLSADILLDVACDFQGQHILREFFESSTVSDEDKDSLLNIFHPLLMRMACSKFGSRTCQSIWPNLTFDQRIRVAGILAKQSLHLRKHWYGAFVFHNFQLHLFINGNKRWRMSQNTKAKKRKIFADILDKNKAVTGSNEDEGEVKQCDEKSSLGKSQPKSKKLKSSSSGK